MTSVIDEHYEEKFEFPLLKLIMTRAQELDISYCDAYATVLPEYERTIRYGDVEWEEEQTRTWNRQLGGPKDAGHE